MTTDMVTKDAAKQLAVAYNAYMDARAAFLGLQLNGANSVIVWGGVLIRAQDECGVVLMPRHLIVSLMDQARFEEAKSAAFLSAPSRGCVSKAILP